MLTHRLSVSVHALHAALARSDRPEVPVFADVAARLAAENIGMEVRLWEPGDPAHGPMTPATAACIRAFGRDHGLPVTAHTEYYTWDPARLASDTRRAADLGARLLVVHPSRFGMEDETPMDVPAVRRLCAQARDLGVTLALENVPSGLPTLQHALDAVGRDPEATGLGICLDTGHANLSATADAIPPVRFVEALRDVIVQVHVHDNNGRDDQHLPPGDGTLDWPPLLEALRTLPARALFCMELGGSDDPWGALQRTRRFLAEAGLPAPGASTPGTDSP
jgi:sugar phosphate isomerase/epimerase